MGYTVWFTSQAGRVSLPVDAAAPITVLEQAPSSLSCTYGRHMLSCIRGAAWVITHKGRCTDYHAYDVLPWAAGSTRAEGAPRPATITILRTVPRAFCKGGEEHSTGRTGQPLGFALRNIYIYIYI